MSNSVMGNRDFSGMPLLKALREAGFTVEVENTGGGVACFYVSKSEPEKEICIGPGYYTDDGVVFTWGDFYISEDMQNRVTGEYKDDFLEANIKQDATVEQMVNAVIDLQRAMDSQ